jgi:deoxyribodipyrimidine photo-lyase
MHRDVHAVWLRQDLRLHDHAPLLAAARGAGALHVVWCLDPRLTEGTRLLGLPRTGPFRARFLREALADLRAGLRAVGSDLVVVRGRPRDEIPRLAERHGWRRLHVHELVGTEEVAEERAVRVGLAAIDCETVVHWDRTLVEPDDLPYPLASVPDVFTRFRKDVERLGGYPAPLAAPTALPAPPEDTEPTDLPTLGEFGSAEVVDDPRAVLRFVGGESAGKERLERYVWDQDLLKRYKDTRNGMVGADYSSKLSPWLALGCLSPRFVQAEVERYERERVRNQSTYWLTFELLWRDYFQAIARRHGAALFRPEGLQGIPVPWQDDRGAFDAWCRGRTGYPLVDANMRELAATGFQSNRGRQNVASFLTKNLGIDWRLGAEWFESLLVDHDVASNYGNWNYVAGVGNDARGFRYFHIPTQAEKYDRKGRHAVLWCPELAPLDPRSVHAPAAVPRGEQERRGCVVGRDYPAPIVDLDESVRRNRAAWERAVGA